MKRFAVLMLVLGMASLAEASLIFDISNLQDIKVIGDGVTIDQAGSAYIMFSGDLVMDASVAVTLPEPIGNPPVYYSDIVYRLPDWRQASSGDAELYADISFNFVGIPFPYPLGKVLIEGLKYVSGSGEMLLISEEEYYYGAQTGDLGSVYIPEPTPMVLLSFGGLLLRRRK